MASDGLGRELRADKEILAELPIPLVIRALEVLVFPGRNPEGVADALDFLAPSDLEAEVHVGKHL